MKIPGVNHLISWTKKAESENWAGATYVLGGSVILLGGETESTVSGLSFMASDAFLMFFGHRSWGYSIGCIGLTVGNGFLLASQVSAGNPIVHGILSGIATCWAVGTLRWPAEKLISENVSKKIQTTVGTAALLQRMALLPIAAAGGNYIIFGSYLILGAADIMLGKLQNVAKWFLGNERQ